MTMQWNARVRLVDEVVSVLRERLYSGYYSPGARMYQDQLARELQVSRTPLREALRMLEQEGLVRVEPNKGVRVISGDVPTLLAAYEVRRVIDGLAARLAAQQATDETVGRLKEIIEVQEQSLSPWDAAAYTAANVDFHRTVMKMSKNEFVVGQMPILLMTARVFAPVEVVEPGRAAVAVPQHREICEAILARAAEVAEEVAMAHIQTTIDAVRKDADCSNDPKEFAEGRE